MEEKEYITEEELENLKKELAELEGPKTKEIAELIKHSASFGDLKENFAYHEAKEKQAFLQGKILELKNRIRNAKIIKKQKSDKIEIGSKVTLKINEEKQTFTIVNPSQADPLKGKISYQSPLGKSLINRKKGEKFKTKIGENETTCEILEIE